MSITVEVSNDQNDWRVYDRNKIRADEWKFLRHLDTVERSWSQGQLNGWLTQKRGQTGTHIEYSTNNGFSWQIFRTAYSKEDAYRLYTIVQNKGYIVRAVTLTENQSNQSQLSNAIQSFSLPQPADVRSKTEHRWVSFDNDAYHILKYQPAVYVCHIVHKIPMSLSIMNENVIERGNDPTAGLNPADNGHVYYLKDVDTLPFKWQTVLDTHTKSHVNAHDWTWVESARVYDNDTYEYSDGLYAMTVLSDKYFVDTVGGQRYKIGNVFLIKRSFAQDFIKNINARLGYAAYTSLSTTYIREKQSDLLERITVVKDELEAAIASRNLDKIAMTMFDAMEFRDKAVDEIKALNKIITKARETAVELADGGSKS